MPSANPNWDGLRCSKSTAAGRTRFLTERVNSWACEYCKYINTNDLAWCVAEGCEKSRIAQLVGPKGKMAYQTANIKIEKFWEKLAEYSKTPRSLFGCALTAEVCAAVLLPVLVQQRLPPFKICWNAAWVTYAKEHNREKDNQQHMDAYKDRVQKLHKVFCHQDLNKRSAERVRLKQGIMALHPDAEFWKEHSIKQDKMKQGHELPCADVPPAGKTAGLMKIERLIAEGVVHKIKGMRERNAARDGIKKVGRTVAEGIDGNGVEHVRVPPTSQHRAEVQNIDD